MTDPARLGARQVRVWKDDGLWRWSCRARPCQASDTAWRHRDAYADACHHAVKHEEFGFRRSDRS